MNKRKPTMFNEVQVERFIGQIVLSALEHKRSLTPVMWNRKDGTLYDASDVVLLMHDISVAMRRGERLYFKNPHPNGRPTDDDED